MSTLLVTTIALVIFLVLIAIRIPVGFALAGAGALGIAMLDGFSVATGTLASIPFSSSAKYTFIVIPLFIFMGVLIAETGIAKEIFTFANRVVGKLSGGLAMATIMACGMFGAVSGSSSATSATMGRVSMNEMSRLGYPKPFAAATVAVAGTLAVLIPPSIVLVMYGILTGESIGKLLIAGVVPGIISLIALMLYVYIWAKLRGRKLAREAATDAIKPNAAPGASDTRVLQAVGAEDAAATKAATAGTATAVTDKNWSPTSPKLPDLGDGKPTKASSGITGLIYVAVLFILVMGGIYTGFFTAAEAAGVGALGAIILGLLHLRKSSNVIRPFIASLQETAATNGMIFGILLGGGVFTVFLVTTQLPAQLTGWILSLDVPPVVVVALIVLAMLPLGMFLDGLSMMVITVPLTYPVVTALGFDGIWFGILVVIAFEIGLITPPVGLNVFVIAGLPGAPPSERIFASAFGFVLLQLGIIALLFAAPSLVTWLPELMSQ